MAVLTFLVDRTAEEELFLHDLRGRLKNPDVAKNPFTSKMGVLKVDKGLFVALLIDPLYPKILPYSGLLLAAVGVLFGWIGLIIAGAFLFSSIVLWSSWFYFFILGRSRKKKGLRGRLVVLHGGEAWMEVLEAWDR